MIQDAAIEAAAIEMFEQHHGPKRTAFRPWSGVAEREGPEWREKAGSGERLRRAHA